MAGMHPAARLLVLVLTVAAVGAATAAADDYRPVFSNYTCSAPGNYSDDSPYAKNLAELLSTLSPASGVDNWWFRQRTVGQISGLAMCFANADADLCHNCLATVSSSGVALLPACDHSREVGFISSDGCVIRYAAATGGRVFGSATADSGAQLVLRTLFRAYDAGAMREARQSLLSGLAVAAAGDARRFATGSLGYNDTVLGKWQVMYGMAQCTRDLPSGECAGCLVDHLNAMYTDASVTNSTSASVTGLSCYLNYQVNEPIHIAGLAAPPAAAPTAGETPSGSAPPLVGRVVVDSSPLLLWQPSRSSLLVFSLCAVHVYLLY